MPLNITPATNHREREKGCVVYPVYSRRSEGLSVGINLYPDKKSCPFDCPYCEVFPFSPKAGFSIDQMRDDLRHVITSALEQNIIIKDICFSGNGEPTLSPYFQEALRLAEMIRAEMTPSSRLVVITNGAGLLQPQIFSLLKEAAINPAMISYNNDSAENMFDIWLKLDAGTSDWYQKMNRTDIQYEKLTEKIKEFVLQAPVTIQTMLCAINGDQPSERETEAWETLVCELAETANRAGSYLRKAQLYGKARAAPEDPLASALPAEYLERRTESLRKKFKEKDIKTPVCLYF